MTATTTVPHGFRETNRIFEEEVVGKGDFGALARVYTSDATVLPPGSAAVHGLPAIQEFWRGAAAALGVTAVQLESVSLEVAGETAYEIGRAQIHRAGGDPLPVKYVVVWKHDAGAWKWHVDIWNAAA